MKVMDDSGLQHQVEIIKSLFDDNDVAIQEIHDDIDDLQTSLSEKASSTHQHASSDITVMTGYTKPSSTSAIAATDSLNVATGKLEKALDNKAPSESPALTGIPTAPTAAAGTNTTQLATTAFVKREISNQMSLNEEMLQTIENLQNALDGDANLVQQLTTEIGRKLDKVSSDYVKQLSISGKNLTVTNGDNSSYVLQTQDTTYPSMTAAQATAGSSTVPMVVTPQVLNNLVESKIGSLSTGVSSVTTGSANGTVSVNGSDVAVKGLGSAAYANTSAFATSSHHHDTRYLSLLQGTGTVISSNTDLDTLKTAGTYYCVDSVTAKTLSHCPYTASNFKLAVMFHGSNKYGLQFLYGYSDESIYVRKMDNGTWSSTWRKVLYNNSTLDATKLSGTIPSSCYTNTVYTHPTNAGNKHIPAGGASGQILRWSADGTAVWGADNNTTYSNFVKSGSGAKAGLVPAPSTTAGTTKYLREDGTWSVPPNTNTTYSNMTAATASAAGKAGLVPAPAAGKQTSFLRGDGTWQVPTNTTYSVFVKSGSTAAAGLVPKPSTTAGTTKYLREDGTWQVPPNTNTTYSNMTAATASAAGKAGLVPAPAAGKQTSFLRGDGTWVIPTNTTYSAFVKSGSTAAAGLVPKPSTTAGTTKYLCEDGTWKVPPDTNTTYSAGTAALLTSGTDTSNRVWTAKMIADYVKSVAGITTSASTNGYMKLPNGIIVQWGRVTVSGNNMITFPTPFTSTLYSLQLTVYNGDPNVEYSYTYNDNHFIYKTNASEAGTAYDPLLGFKCYTDSHNRNIYWVAIGK